MSERLMKQRNITARLAAFLLTAVIALTPLLHSSITASALTADEATKRLQEIMKKEYPQGKKFESSGFSNSWQCFGFAKKIVYLLTGDVTNWRYDGKAVSGLTQVAQLKRGNYGKSQMQEFISKALPGDIIQADKGNRDRQHTMIFCWTNKNGTFTVYDANTTGYNTVAVREITYSRWSSKSWNNITLLRSTKMKDDGKSITKPSINLDGPLEDDIFDADYYLNRYEDLRELYGDDKDALYEHWTTKGIEEGRSASPVLDLPYYVANNPDLQDLFGLDYEKAYEHFITTGCNEFRKSSPYYDPAVYKNSDSSLEKLTSKELILNFIINYEE